MGNFPIRGTPHTGLCISKPRMVYIMDTAPLLRAQLCESHTADCRLQRIQNQIYNALLFLFSPSATTLRPGQTDAHHGGREGEGGRGRGEREEREREREREITNRRLINHDRLTKFQRRNTLNAEHRISNSTRHRDLLLNPQRQSRFPGEIPRKMEKVDGTGRYTVLVDLMDRQSAMC